MAYSRAFSTLRPTRHGVWEMKTADLSYYLISSSCELPSEGSDVGDERPGNSAGDGRLEILCQSTTATEPCESTFDDPSAW